MAERNNDILSRLRNGERIKCPQCHEGIIKPYNALPDKAHNFYCSNETCDNRYHWDPIINIE